MAKVKTAYVCNDCGADFNKWQGQCNFCNAWNTISEIRLGNIRESIATNVSRSSGSYGGENSEKAINPSEVTKVEHLRFNTGIGEFDRVMGGGVTIGSATLISGSPGAGKTTLLTLLAALLSASKKVIYITGEENQNQWKNRQDRVAPHYVNDNMFILVTDSLDKALEQTIEKKAEFAIYDSIQSFVASTADGSKGSVSQVKECGSEITKFAKQNNVTTFIVGQVTKDNTMAGPKVLEHTIDTHIHLEKSEYSNLRTLRSMKNRFGSEETVGLFKMEGEGMIEISDPSAEFRSTSSSNTSGCATTCLRASNRSILVEIQALVVESQSEKLQRVCLGVNFNRVQLIAAILRKHCGKNFYADIFISVVGGLKISEQDTSSDLAIAAALVSSLEDKVIHSDTCFIGELTLSGEVKSVPNGVQRVEEAIRHGFKKIYISQQLLEQLTKKTDKSKLIAINNIRGLMNAFN
ncbi:DNA repair protein RadA [Vibrio vulnificus]|nr:DNA repair protein RadA [Vibrio vulnificus]